MKDYKQLSRVDLGEMNITIEQAVTFRAILDLIDLCKRGVSEHYDKHKASGYSITEIKDYFDNSEHLKNVFNSTIRLCRHECGDDNVNRVLNGLRRRSQ